MKKIFTLLFILSFGLVFSANISKNENNKLACPTATIMYVGSPFCSNDGIANNVTITGTDAYMGGVYSCMPAGLSISPVTGAITPSLSTPGTYTVTYTIPSVGGCPVVSANTTVTVRGAAQVMFTTTFRNQTVCAFQPIINITAATTNATGASVIGLPPGINYSWAANNVTISGAGTNPGTYNYTITTTGGCSAAVINATITILPYPGASVNSSTVCSGSSATVTATPSTSGTYSYSWTVPAGASNPGNVASFSTSVAGTYSVILNNTGTGCSGTSSSGIVTVTPLPNATVTPASQTICAGSSASINFTGTPNATVSYTINGGSTQSITLNSSGNATLPTTPLTSNTVYNLVSVSSASGCFSPVSGSAVITVTPSPTMSVSSTSLSICSGEYAFIELTSSSPGTTFIWSVTEYNGYGASDGIGTSNPFTIEQNLNSFSSGGIVTYTITPILNGCMGTPQTVTVIVNPIPLPTIQDGYICINGLTGDAISNYFLQTGLNSTDNVFSWYYEGNLIPGATSDYYSTNQTGTYSVEAYNTITGCSSPLIFATVGSVTSAQSMSTTETLDGNGNYTITINVNGSGTYFYQLDGGPYETSNIFADVPSGEHTIHVIDYEGCTDLTTTQTLSSNEFYSQNFVVSPNPVTDILNIKNNQTINKVTAFNQLGQMVFEKEYNNNEVQLDFSGLKTGIYFISVNSDKKQSTFKIVKN